MHVARYDLRTTRPRVVRLPGAMHLATWSREAGVPDAIVGGFFIRSESHPLGEVRIAGRELDSVPFDEPWGAIRSCVHFAGHAVRIARRDELAPSPAGDLLQAGPLLLRAGATAVRAGEDPEGFSAASHQFDSDITIGRYPRAALGLAGTTLIAAVCDGRADDEAGLTMAELAEAMAGLGARDALNLDGGGSASLVTGGKLRNRPREEHGIELAGGRPVVTAIAFEPVGPRRRLRAFG